MVNDNLSGVQVQPIISDTKNLPNLPFLKRGKRHPEQAKTFQPPWFVLLFEEDSGLILSFSVQPKT